MEEIIKALQNNEIIIVTDDENRENEADMICAGEKVTGEMINIMAKYARGLICTPIGKNIARQFDLEMMVKNNTDNHETAFTVSIDHVDTETGISAFERAQTIRALADNNTKASDFRRPGHVFPLIAKDRGVLVREGHTEATIDLMKIANLKEIGLCCEIMADDGHMLRGKAVVELAQKLGMKMTSVAEIKKYIKENNLDFSKNEENFLEKTNIINLPTDHGKFKAISFYDKVEKKEHLALIKGKIDGENILTRIHSECLTGDVFSSNRCDCGNQLHKAMEMIDEKGEGIILYLRQEGRGIGLFNKIKAYHLQEEGYDTVDANIKLGFAPDLRNYKIACLMLKELGVKSIDLLTNNPDKIEQVEKYNIKVNKRVPIEIHSNHIDRIYLKTKADRMGHDLREFKER
ncbi:bifunctional 3,4-dihydroxy-2-butanone-4-phosphate synthase/GTP cyclohydrolase II [Anaerococcus obesiensis]|uniref:GTP cyclohydrolase-2 n=1 Tax=Anaerococcus obesiensis TaxID=1287640 RepID=A0A7T7UT66_9FIRM|nr:MULTISPECIES: bifunctional 3,4-dihydroxy-2-butanone-4-phosphate synthase/GTP cyclohydrolase II [Anaerococcus]MDU1030304.1 bifunctional 3,4-dihydroxy-2-butanone-4-phosphate synthase/GTP cyclohydrolase II [Anaerococcus vaginalis]QQN55718.1 bifunctional 3,4-dihydroxy-2-butanone-4-phosphate synthase/GTP cyclohydrolase II [Anaerococcus obesiensis]